MDEHNVFADLADQAIPVSMKEGSLLAFDGVVFHGTGANTSGSDRLAVTLAYRSVDELSEHKATEEVLVRGQYLYRGNRLGSGD
jgi:ectoine hydroxylase-related dioxygenase (phytanoyl-CoA dioxygenase family)